MADSARRAESGGGSEMPDWVKTFLILVIITTVVFVLDVILPQEVWDFLMKIFPSKYEY
jgi:hypothetical protein